MQAFYICLTIIVICAIFGFISVLLDELIDFIIDKLEYLNERH